MARLILTADDFGACDFIDQGIYTALRERKINTVSAFVTHSDSEERLRELISFRESEREKYGNYTFHIGLHFSITSGTSATGLASSLTADEAGDGRYYFHEAKDYPFHKIKTDDLKIELQAQLEKISFLLGGSRVDHVSNHHGITYVDSRFFNAYAETIAAFGAQKYDRPVPVRSPRSWIKSGLKYWKGGRIVAPTVRQGIELGFWKRIFDVTRKKINERKIKSETLHISSPDLLADTIYGQPYSDNIRFLMEQLRNQALSSEFMFHLGENAENFIDPENMFDIPHGIDHYYFLNRLKELEAIRSLDFNFLVKENNLQKISFSDLS